MKKPVASQGKSRAGVAKLLNYVTTMKPHPLKTCLLAACLTTPAALAIQPPADDAPPPPPLDDAAQPPVPRQPAAAANDAAPAMPAEAAAEAPAFLGVTCGEIPEMLAAHLDLPEGQGVVVLAVLPQSPAATAGIARHDVILSVDGEPVASHEDLSAKTSARKPGDTAAIQLLRKGEKLQVDAVLGERPDLAELGMAEPEIGLDNLLFEGVPMDQANRLRDLIERNQRAMRDAGRMIEDNGFFDALREMEGQMQLMFQDGKPLDVDPLPEREGFGKIRMNTGATVRLMDEQGSVELKAADDSKEVTVRDRDNEIIWTGPWDTDQDKAAAPAGIRERIERLNIDKNLRGGGLRFNLRGDDNR